MRGPANLRLREPRAINARLITRTGMSAPAVVIAVAVTVGSEGAARHSECDGQVGSRKHNYGRKLHSKLACFPHFVPPFVLPFGPDFTAMQNSNLYSG